MFIKIYTFISASTRPVLLAIIFLLLIIIVLFAIVSFFVIFLKNQRKTAKVNIIRQNDDHYLVWFYNYHKSLNAKRNFIDSNLIITRDKKEILRINNPTNVGKYKLSDEFIAQNVKFKEEIKGIFNVNYFTKTHNIKIRNVFVKDISKSNIVLIKNFSCLPFVRFKKNGYELDIAIDFDNSKNIDKISLLLFDTNNIDEEEKKRIEIKRIRNTYKFILKQKEDEDYACAILQIIMKDKNDRYAPPQIVEEILYFE